MAATSLNTTFESGGHTETLDLSADAYSTWLEIPADMESVTFQVVIANTDVVGVLKCEGRINSSLAAITPLPFEETDGTVTTAGYAITTGTDVNTAFIVPRHLTQVRWFYDRTSGGAAQTATVAAKFSRA